MKRTIEFLNDSESDYDRINKNKFICKKFNKNNNKDLKSL